VNTKGPKHSVQSDTMNELRLPDHPGTSDLLRTKLAPPRLRASLVVREHLLARLDRRGILVLEDYHVITSPQIHATLAFLIDHLPATLHLLVMTRSDPPLPLARLRAHDELCELRAADLRFSETETAAFLQQALALPPSERITDDQQRAAIKSICHSG
jgi:ATP/maltotriose-dependent transcriptional regulator MalT